ncbi:MAG: SMC family ATPase [Desulfobulbaceae bacterium]|nr:SMC family ATPase [Desulfobulbaceae bacterium]
MKPTKITIQGFGPYGPEPQTLIFGDGKVLVLMGTNGGGKSSVIEAQLWARYGACISRTGSKIINNSCDNCAVTEEAVVAGQLYKWTRTLKRTNKGGSEGSFDLQAMQGEKWVSINEKTAGQTTDKLIGILGVDFDGAICTDVLAQGKSGEFSNLGPTGKKGVVRQVLMLGVYQDMSDKAGVKAKSIREGILRMTGAIEVALAEIARMPEVEADIAAKEAGVALVKTEVSEAEKRVESCERVVVELEEKQRKAEELKREADIYRRQHADIDGEMGRKDLELDNLNHKLLEVKDLQQLITDAGNVDERVTEHAKKRELYREKSAALQLSEERYSAKTREITGKLDQFEVALSRARQDVRNMEQAIADANADAARKAELEALPVGDIDVHNAEAIERLAREALSKIMESYAVKNSECKGLEAKIKLLSEYDGAVCEFCGSDLTGEHKDRELERLDSNLHLAQAERDDLIKKGTAARVELETAEKTLNAVRQEKETVERRQIEITRLARVTERLPELSKKLNELQIAVTESEMDERNAKKAMAAHTEDISLAELEDDMVAVGYDREAESRDLSAQNNVKAAKEELQKSAERQARVDVLKREIIDLQGKMLELDGQINPRSEQVRALMEEVQRHSMDAKNAAAKAEEEFRKKREELRQAETALAGAELQLEALRKTKAGISEKEAEIKAEEKEQQTYETLQKALGPNGVQAMLIDHAAPAIEWEANQVLARIAPSKKIRIDTQKESLTGKVSEGLEIVVVDERGELPYGSYSGGYKFRLDVAIRIALTNVLGAMGSGGERSLTIDEGFGSLDTEGIESMIAAIYDVVAAEYFDKIIIVSHLDQMKSAFDEVAYFSLDTDGFSKIN